MKIEKETYLGYGKKLLAYWSNNKGRGKDNCTLIVVPDYLPRPYFSRDVKVYYAKILTSSWNGDVNITRHVREVLGIKREGETLKAVFETMTLEKVLEREG